MTRDELIEAMARAILPVCRDAFAVECLGPNSACEHGSCGCSDIAFAAAEAALSAIEAVAAVVPQKATVEMIDAAQRAWTPGVSYAEAHQIRFAAMLEASPFRSKPRARPSTSDADPV